ncbi:MAG TPA: dihydrofolate reductase family protein [Anaerolineales bacterium]|nr:dihydrofolate reductase family protein [Anaerolineales bacterium]
MSRIVVFNSVTLDGVMQAPGRADEDLRGGFKYGGWAAPYADPGMGKAAGESMATSGGLLLGRRTYEDFYKVWPNRTDNPFTEVLDNAPKYVASTTLKEPLPWMNSILLKGGVPRAVADLKAQSGKDIVVLGSGELLQTLMQYNLIDLYILLIHPLILGSGTRLFREGDPVIKTRLLSSQTTSTGVVAATYQPLYE